MVEYVCLGKNFPVNIQYAKLAENCLGWGKGVFPLLIPHFFDVSILYRPCVTFHIRGGELNDTELNPRCWPGCCEGAALL